MENASKALIIAGSILLSILIIALGMFIFNNSSSTSDGMTTTLSENEKQTFNVKFEKYKGEQTGSSVDALVSAVRSNASTNKNSAEKIPTVTYTSGGTSPTTTTASGGVELVAGDTLTTYMTALTTMTNDIEKSHMYDVELGYNDAGLVSTITITY